MTTVAPETSEVHEFVARVRLLLADLDAEEQQELTTGLEADLSDLVAERGADALGDPATYARELRVAAGHPAEMSARPGGRSLREAVMAAVDSTHDSWDRVLDSFPGDPRGFLTSIQPAWWVLRAGVAWMVTQSVRGPYLVADGFWLTVLAAYVVVSVQLGRGRWGTDRLLDRSVLARLLLVGLNVMAVAMLPGAVNDLSWRIAESRAWEFADYSQQQQDVNPGVIRYLEQDVCDLEVRDAAGRIVPDVEVWDVTGGRPLPMHNDRC